MQISKLKLVNFRNFEKIEFEFSKYKNIIIGKNGIGKTNIVESIYYLALTKSFRTYDDLVLIQENADKSIIQGEIKTKYKNNYKIIIEKPGKKVYINNNQIYKLSDYISKINVIMFNHEDLKLIKDSPSIHRKLINMEISQLNNKYLKLLTNYNKILKQRNTYLKSMLLNSMIPKDYLYILTEKLIDIGLELYSIRKKFIDEINIYLNQNFQKITKKDGLILKYVSEYEDLTKEQLIKKYNQNFPKDLNYGKTNIGIHLDDFIFYYKSNLAKNYLSEGEQKNSIISFKLAEINIFYKQTKTMPILILDDLFSELDKTKINNIFKFIDNDIQTFITTTEITKLSKKLRDNSKIFIVNNGVVDIKES